MLCSFTRLLFFFNDPATTEIYTLSLHDALPICVARGAEGGCGRSTRDGAPGEDGRERRAPAMAGLQRSGRAHRSEEHTSELQSRRDLVCRLLLEKKKKKNKSTTKTQTTYYYT